jgi:hypothetical protein
MCGRTDPPHDQDRTQEGDQLRDLTSMQRGRSHFIVGEGRDITAALHGAPVEPFSALAPGRVRLADDTEEPGGVLKKGPYPRCKNQSPSW